jgi:AraC family transcriptional regulator
MTSAEEQQRSPRQCLAMGNRPPASLPASSFSYYRSKTGELDRTLRSGSVVTASSWQLGWDGAVAEMGRSNVWDPTELSTDGHYLAINLDSTPLPMEAREGCERRLVTVPPGGFLISPAGVPFTMRILEPSHYGAVEISLPKVRRVLGRDLGLEPALGVVDEPLSEVLRTLLAEIVRGGSSGSLYADGLLVAIISRLASAFGTCPQASSKGALSGERLDRITEAINDRLAERLTVEELATIAGLSPAHFARAFKRTMHETPHALVLRNRLERARGLLLEGTSIVDTALRCGFSDQAHLSRAFKQRFGVTPGTMRASRR